MNPSPGTDLEIRCFCAREPLMALAGRDSHGGLYVHLKVFKAKRLFAEMVATSGCVWLHCRDCYRWHRIVIKNDVQVTEGKLPRPIPVQ